MERHSNSGDENDDIELVGDPADFDEMGNPIGVTSEYDEHGDPTPESLQRWEARRAARAQKLLDEVRETIAEVRRERAEKIAAGIETACVGKGTCGLCRVKILAGAEHLNPFTDEERKHLGNVYHITKVRLSCRAKLADGDVTLQVVRKKK